MKTAAMILAAGSGLRMGAEIPKQFLKIKEKPLFLYSVEKFRKAVSTVLVVTREEWIPTVRTMLDEAGFPDVFVSAGGNERYESSMRGLEYLQKICGPDNGSDTCGSSSEKDSPGFGNSSKPAACVMFDIVLIHDAARCLISDEVIGNVLKDTETHGAAVASVPSKDTIKLADPDGFVKATPERKECFVIQTPQGFRTDWLEEGFEKLKASLETPENKEKCGEPATKSVGITDDASVIEKFTDHPVFLSKGDYRNIKVTTPEDLFLAEALIQN